MVPYEYPAHLKRPLAKAADELVERGWLVEYEFIKVGKFHRVRFYRTAWLEPVQLPLVQNCDPNCDSEVDLYNDIWTTIVARSPRLAGTRLIAVEDGTATVAAGGLRDWIENRLGEKILKELQRDLEQITAVRFVE